jgi:hypothetical protein
MHGPMNVKSKTCVSNRTAESSTDREMISATVEGEGKLSYLEERSSGPYPSHFVNVLSS